MRVVQFDEPKIDSVLAVEQDELLVVVAVVSLPAQRHASGIEPIDVVGVPQVVGIAVLTAVDNQTDRDAAIARRDDRVGVPLVGDAEHDRVELQRLLVVGGDTARVA